MPILSAYIYCYCCLLVAVVLSVWRNSRTTLLIYYSLLYTYVHVSSPSISRPSHISHITYHLTTPFTHLTSHSHPTVRLTPNIMSHISCTLCTCILYYKITNHTLSSPASTGALLRVSLVNHSQPPSFCDPAIYPLQPINGVNCNPPDLNPGCWATMSGSVKVTLSNRR